MIKLCFSEGFSVRKISEKTAISVGSVQGYIKANNLTRTRPITVKPRKVSRRLGMMLVENFGTGAFKNRSDAKQYLANNYNVEVSKNTISRILHSFGIRSYAKVKKYPTNGVLRYFNIIVICQILLGIGTFECSCSKIFYKHHA